MADTRIITDGVPGGVYDLLEINDFVKNDKFFTLYIRALQALQDIPESKDKSFFGIGGIHGEPFELWNGAPGGTRGYCNHGSVLFPTWHRPYVLQLEQLIHEEAKKCARKFTTDQVAWAMAANELRLPYWDWAKNIIPPPEVIEETNVKITDYDGKTAKVVNPLLHYIFKGREKEFKDPTIQKYKITLRHPKRVGTEYTHDVPKLRSTLKAIGPNITLRIYLMLTERCCPQIQHCLLRNVQS